VALGFFQVVYEIFKNLWTEDFVLDDRYFLLIMPATGSLLRL